MKWVGLTGGMGCGKSTALKEFKTLGYGTASADELVHELYKSPSVVEEVCDLLKIPKESFSMSAVSKVVFKDSKKLKALEDLIHPKLRDKVNTLKVEFKKQGYKISFYEIPLLFEKSLQDRFDFTVCVGASEEVQFERIKNRNDWGDDEIRARLSHQMSLVEKKERSDFYIDNSGSLEELKDSCRRLTDQILG
jgi:dephospho-CoA kinase